MIERNKKTLRKFKKDRPKIRTVTLNVQQTLNIQQRRKSDKEHKHQHPKINKISTKDKTGKPEQ